MILLVTNHRDITTDYVVLELQRRGLSYFRLNTEQLPEYRVTMGALSRDDWTIDIDGCSLTGEQIKAAYFRRPGKPSIPNSYTDQGARRYTEAEWSAWLRSWYMRLEGVWLNSPMSIMSAEDKPLQLILATELGFTVPKSVITNDIHAAKSIADQHSAIGKPMRQALLEGKQEKVIFTTRLPKLTNDHASAVAKAPVIIQQEIIKRFDVRVTVIGDRVFPVAIHSQEQKQTEVDWRQGSKPNLTHEVIQLPKELEIRCIQLVRSLGLRYGAIDLVLDREGHFWFLEINPNGQWAWIENRTRLPIASAIVDELEVIAC